MPKDVYSRSMHPAPSHQARHTLGNLVFACVAAASLAFWVFELRYSMSGYDEREREVLAAYQQRQLELKAESLRDSLHEIHQTGRTISLLPEIREAKGGNRASAREDAVRQGRLTAPTQRILQQIYANLSAYTSVSEIYFVLDGFAPERGEVPFFMLDDHVAGRDAIVVAQRDRARDRPEEDEEAEYLEIGRQLAWFRTKAPIFNYGNELNLIPARISGLLRTCDTTQIESRQNESVRDTQGLLYSLPVYDAHSGRFKGQITIVLRANIIEAKLLDIPYLPVTREERARMVRDGWQMPPPSPFLLLAREQNFEVADRRNKLFADGLAAARQATGALGRWGSLEIQLTSSDRWELHHYLDEAEIERLVGPIRTAKRLSVAGRMLLLVVLSAFLGWGFWLMRASRQELLRMAHYDPLTELPNRRLFFERMQAGMARARRNGSKMGLFFVDLASLNAINDRYGHQGGDQLLAKVARRLHRHLRASDAVYEGERRDAGNADAGRDGMPAGKVMLARLGGDEFTILCEDLHASDDLIMLAERIVDGIAAPFLLGDEAVEVKLNVGAALFPDDAADAERLLMSADSAMHECKETHGRYVLFNEEMRQRGERLHLLVLELKTAVQNMEQFELYYQPKATLLDGRVVSMEGLIRWHHPTLGLVAPLEFIPILERNGAIVELGEWIVEQACRDLQRLSREGFPDIKLSVNVSVEQLKRGHFHRFLKTALERHAIDPARLILEITETVVIDDLKQGRAAILELKQLGVCLAIDDFGAGYSSLTYLQHLPLDSLKIDKSLIDGMVDARAINVVEAVIRLAQGLSLKTIAEGIETEEQRALITRLGCDMMQGYLLSRPQPLPVIIDWLKERSSH